MFLHEVLASAIKALEKKEQQNLSKRNLLGFIAASMNHVGSELLKKIPL